MKLGKFDFNPFAPLITMALQNPMFSLLVMKGFVRLDKKGVQLFIGTIDNKKSYSIILVEGETYRLKDVVEQALSAGLERKEGAK
jgi:hypothetical protein